MRLSCRHRRSHYTPRRTFISSTFDVMSQLSLDLLALLAFFGGDDDDDDTVVDIDAGDDADLFDEEDDFSEEGDNNLNDVGDEDDEEF
jgi:hypothetical protein